jgi:hypothetical protein
MMPEDQMLAIDLPIERPQMRRMGCGGTDANHAIQRINELAMRSGVVCGVIITDGYVPPIRFTPMVPILWLITQVVPVGIDKQYTFRVEVPNE